MSRTVTFWRRGVAGLRLGSKRLDPTRPPHFGKRGCKRLKTKRGARKKSAKERYKRRQLPVRKRELFPLAKVQLKMTVAEDLQFSHKGVPPL
jgi:hypothetical protein